MATCPSILAWKIPGTEEPGGLPSIGSQSRTRLSEFTFFSFFLWGGSLQKGPVVQAHSSRGLTGG